MIRNFILGIVAVLSIGFAHSTAKAQQPYLSDYTSPALQEVLNQAKDNHTITIVDCSAFNCDKPDSNYLVFKTLSEKATIPELVMLLNHPYSNIRAYAFLVLSETTDIDIYPFLVLLLNDSACLEEVVSCWEMGSRFPCRTNFDFFFDLSTSSYKLKSQKINEYQLDLVDSLVIFNNNQSYAQIVALHRSKPNEYRYYRIKELWIKYENTAALLALAKYRRSSDIPCFFRTKQYHSVSYLYPAIEAFPHDTFFSILQEASIKFKFRILEEEKFYRALSAYKSEKSATELSKCLERLDTMTDNKTQYLRKEHLIKALTDHLDTNYNNLLFNLWDDGLFTPKTISFLKTNYPELTLEKSINTLDSFERIFLYPSGLYNFSLDTSFNLMLDIVFEHDSTLAIKLLAKFLASSTDLMAQNLIKRAEQIGSEAFIDPLFSMLLSDNFNIAIPNATQALIDFNKPVINRRLKTIAIDRKGTYWGDKIGDVLMQNGIN